MNSLKLALGIDFGTSGIRGAVVDLQKQVLWQSRQVYPEPSSGLAQSWQAALFAMLCSLPNDIARAVGAIAINGTSATLLLIDEQGNPVTEPLMYYDGRAKVMIDQIRSFAPAESPVVSATSSLAKLIWWYKTLPPPRWERARYCLSQADWLSARLHGKYGISDYHNTLKLGYDVGELCYPPWLSSNPWSFLLPQVVPPGTVIGPIQPSIGKRFNLSSGCKVVAGTTDSIAAFLASGAHQVGNAVTSLGSTLVLKLLSRRRVDVSKYGIYSHRLGDLWLVGGASNSGGAVLQHFFEPLALAELSQNLNPNIPAQFDYYPLLTPGERFPINDPTLPPRLTPRPTDDMAFLRELLWSMTHIEKQGYDLLETLGASALNQVYTAGGGAQNKAWRMMRARTLQKPIKTAAHPEAAVGSAYLAFNGMQSE